MDYSKYMYLFGLTAEELITRILPEFLKENGYDKVYLDQGEVDVPNAFLFAEGTIPILMVAHVDTVFPTERCLMEPAYHNQVIITNTRGGLGADDRAGIAAIMEIISTTDLRPHILFMNYEERACRGDFYLAEKGFKIPEVKYMIELDRMGANDCVFYELVSPEFEAYIQKFGYETNHGTFSDISVLMPYFGVAGVNLSIGYYRMHSAGEYLDVSHWEQSVKRVIEMLRHPPDQVFPFKTTMDAGGWCIASKLCRPYIPQPEPKPPKRKKEKVKAVV